MSKLISAALLSLILAGCATRPEASTDWTPLFNGRDLSGWSVQCKPRDMDKTFWSVNDGSILCDSIGRADHDYVWLVSEKDYTNFELRLAFQVYTNSPGNSGVQFRSRFDPSDNGGRMNGPQVDIHPPASMNWRTGLIYDETRGEQRWIWPSLKNARMDPNYKPARFRFKYAGDGDGWNELVLICRGNHVKTIVNGITRADWDGTGVLDNEIHLKHDVGQQGRIALQLHKGDQLRIRFRDIEIKEIQP